MSSAADAMAKGADLQSAGRYAEAADAFADAVALAVDPGDVATATLKAASCAFRAGQIVKAQTLWRALATDETKPASARVEAASNLSVVEQHHGDIHAAMRAATAAMALATKHGLAATVARCRGNLGLMSIQLGKLEAAEVHLLESANGFGQIGDRLGQGRAWNALGELSLRRGQADVAASRFHDAFELLRHLGAAREAAVPAANLAHLMRRLGRARDALLMYREVQSVLSAEGDEAAGAWRDLASVHGDLGDHEEGDTCLANAEAVVSTELASAHLSMDRAGWCSQGGRLSLAAAAIADVKEALGNAGDLRGLASIELMARSIAWRRGEAPGRPSDFLSQITDPEIVAALQWERAERAFENGDLEGAQASAETLIETFTNLGEPQRAATAWGLAKLCELMRFPSRRVEITKEIDLTLQTMVAFGDVRTTLSVGAGPMLMLSLLGETDSARALHRTLVLHAREEWPEPWRLCLRQVDAILALPECIVVEAPEEGAVEQHLQSAIAALGATDSTGWSRALGALQKLDRLTLVAALSGLPARVGLAEALAADAKGVA